MSGRSGSLAFRVRTPLILITPPRFGFATVCVASGRGAIIERIGSLSSRTGLQEGRQPFAGQLVEPDRCDDGLRHERESSRFNARFEGSFGPLDVRSRRRSATSQEQEQSAACEKSEG